jgi:hypothetical protein
VRFIEKHKWLCNHVWLLLQQTPAQQRQQAAAAQRERERVARANGTTVGLPAPPTAAHAPHLSFSRKREKNAKKRPFAPKVDFP